MVYYRRDGKLKWEVFGRGAEAEAAAWRRQEELGLAWTRPPREDYGPAFVEIAEAYQVNKSFSPNSRKYLLIRLKTNILPFFGLTPAVRIDDNDMDRYVESRRGKGVKDATIRRELTDIKAILNWAAKRRPPLLLFNPIRDYVKPAENDLASLQPPTDEEVGLILAHASSHLLRALKLSWFLGLRPGAVELLRLTWQSVNWTSKTIMVVSARKGGPAARAVPIHKDFLDELKGWREADGDRGPIVHYKGKSIGKLNTTWWNTLERAGLRVRDKKTGKIDKTASRRLRMYDFRHRFVTSALEAGADMKALFEVFGSRPETLMRFYQHVTRDLHRQTVDKIPAPPPPAAPKATRKPEAGQTKGKPNVVRFPRRAAR